MIFWFDSPVIKLLFSFWLPRQEKYIGWRVQTYGGTGVIVCVCVLRRATKWAGMLWCNKTVMRGEKKKKVREGRAVGKKVGRGGTQRKITPVTAVHGGENNERRRKKKNNNGVVGTWRRWLQDARVELGGFVYFFFPNGKPWRSVLNEKSIETSRLCV